MLLGDPSSWLVHYRHEYYHHHWLSLFPGSILWQEFIFSKRRNQWLLNWITLIGFQSFTLQLVLMEGLLLVMAGCCCSHLTKSPKADAFDDLGRAEVPFLSPPRRFAFPFCILLINGPVSCITTYSAIDVGIESYVEKTLKVCQMSQKNNLHTVARSTCLINRFRIELLNWIVELPMGDSLNCKLRRRQNVNLFFFFCFYFPCVLDQRISSPRLPNRITNNFPVNFVEPTEIGIGDY